jgi:hypothetical protein
MHVNYGREDILIFENGWIKTIISTSIQPMADGTRLMELKTKPVITPQISVSDSG